MVGVCSRLLCLGPWPTSLFFFFLHACTVHLGVKKTTSICPTTSYFFKKERREGLLGSRDVKVVCLFLSHDLDLQMCVYHLFGIVPSRVIIYRSSWKVIQNVDNVLDVYMASIIIIYHIGHRIIINAPNSLRAAGAMIEWWNFDIRRYHAEIVPSHGKGMVLTLSNHFCLHLLSWSDEFVNPFFQNDRAEFSLHKFVKFGETFLRMAHTLWVRPRQSGGTTYPPKHTHPTPPHISCACVPPQIPMFLHGNCHTGKKPDQVGLDGRINFRFSAFASKVVYVRKRRSWKRVVLRSIV